MNVKKEKVFHPLFTIKAYTLMIYHVINIRFDNI